jgi:hypothetical protein
MKKFMIFVAGIIATVVAQKSYEKNDAVKNVVDTAWSKVGDWKEAGKEKIRDLVS